MEDTGSYGSFGFGVVRRKVVIGTGRYCRPECWHVKKWEAVDPASYKEVGRALIYMYGVVMAGDDTSRG